MDSLEEEVRVLKQTNSQLVRELQTSKILAGQREKEKLELMKEINDLRLKLSRLRSNGNLLANNFDTSLQSASEKALALLVRASTEIAKIIELDKAYLRDREELDAISPRWSSLSGTPSTDKKERVHRVPPMMMGGQSIQPVVALSRTILDISNIRSSTRTANQNRNTSDRLPLPMPMHMLQDVYIPLTRIDATDLQTHNVEPGTEPNSADNSTEDLGLDDSDDRILEESERMSEDEDYNSTRRLDMVSEEFEPDEEEDEEDVVVTPPRNRLDNPLEGPSWLLDTSAEDQLRRLNCRVNLEPDSTTGLDESVRNATSPPTTVNNLLDPGVPSTPAFAFSPTVRRRKRTSSPFSPKPLANRRNRCFGVWKRRFPVVALTLRLSLARVNAVIIATAVLHNICRLQKLADDTVDEEIPSEVLIPPLDTVPQHEYTDTTPNTERDTLIAQYFDNNNGRVLKVLVAKMTLEEACRARSGGWAEAGEGGSPPKRLALSPQFDAPSPNGATVAGVIVSDTNESLDDLALGEPSDLGRRPSHHDRSRHGRSDHDNSHHEDVHPERSKRGRRTNADNNVDEQSVAPNNGSVNRSRKHECRSVSRTEQDSRATYRYGSNDSRDSDSSGGDNNEGRTRRTRKVVTYKEKPLNRKMRR